MKIYGLLSPLLVIFIVACLFGLQASAIESAYQYSQFYAMTTGSVPSNVISASQPIEIAGNTPLHVYLGEQMQSVSYTQYLSTPSYTGGNSLWIKGATAWTQYAVVPQGATVSLIAISSAGGSGSFTSDGQIYSNSYVLYPNSQLTFYAGTIGRHTLSFVLNSWASNQVVIDVVADTSYTQPSYYPGYYWNYPWNIYQSYYEPLNPPRDHSNGAGTSTKPGENPEGDPSKNPGGDSGKKPSENPNDIPEGNPSGNPSGEHGTEIRGAEAQTSGNPGRDTKTGEAPSNPPSTNPSGDHGTEIRGAEAQTSGNPGVGHNKCDTGYHLENGKCVPDP